MCGVCEQVKSMSQKSALNAISEEVSRRGMTKHLSTLMDRVLGTQVEEEIDTKREGRAFRAMKERSTVDPE